MEQKKEIYIWRTIASFLLVLFAMPIGHAVMILMEKYMDERPYAYCRVSYRACGLVVRSNWGFRQRRYAPDSLGIFGRVIIFWTPVEILGRVNEFWVEPEKYALPMALIAFFFLVLGVYLWWKGTHRVKKS